MAYKPLTITPKDGGRLASGLSGNEVGLQNYRIKRDFRRYLDREKRREGHDYFANAQANALNANEPINLIYTARSATDNTAVFAGTPTRLFRYFNAEGGYVDGVDSFYYFAQTGPNTPVMSPIPDATIPVWALDRNMPNFLGAVFQPGAVATQEPGSNTVTIQGGQFSFTTAMVGSILLFRNGFVGVITALIDAANVTIDAVPVVDVHYPAYVGNINVRFSIIAASSYQAAPDAPYNLDTTSPAPYFSDDYVEIDNGWQLIAGGFSPSGQRWEYETVGNTVFFNNGVDLPVAYAMNDFKARPVYELREQGVASARTIASHNSTLLIGDVLQIKPASLNSVMSPVLQTGTALEAGAIFSDGSLATQLPGSGTVTVVEGGFLFTRAMMNLTLRFKNGFSSTIIGIGPTGGSLSSPIALLEDAPPPWSEENVLELYQASEVVVGTVVYNGNINQPFAILLPNSTSNIVEATDPVFDPSMVGINIYWASGQSRQIAAYIDPQHVLTNSDYPIPAGPFYLDNQQAFGVVTDPQIADRFVYRVAWSALNDGNVWAASIPCSITAGTRVLFLAFPAPSFSPGDAVLITGAGLLGGNLQANITSINGEVWTLDEFAQTTVSQTNIVNGQNLGATVIKQSAVGSNVGFDDLDSDGSAVLRMLTLNSSLIVYRETGYMVGSYNPTFDANGDLISAFQFAATITTPHVLFFRNCLIKATLNGFDFHLYAGQNHFYRLDMIYPLPNEFSPSQPCDNVFFDQTKEATFGVTTQIGRFPVTINYNFTDYTFMAKNELTEEIFICFPSSGTDQALIFDYRASTFSTTTAAFSAAGTVLAPGLGNQKWFVMGTMSGTVLMYGLTKTTTAAWGSTEMFNRLGQPYTSELFSGLGGLNADIHEKTINTYVLQLSNFSPDTETTVDLYSAENPDDPAVEMLLESRDFTDLQRANYFPCYYLNYYFADRILVEGKDNPMEIAARMFNFDIVPSLSVTRQN